MNELKIVIQAYLLFFILDKYSVAYYSYTNKTCTNNSINNALCSSLLWILCT